MTQIAIVGAGPMCCYFIERIIANNDTLKDNLKIDIFERSGHFGSGIFHHSQQSHSNLLNRSFSEVAVHYNQEKNSASIDKIPDKLSFDFKSYCADLGVDINDNFPSRAIHGKALEQAFIKYVDYLKYEKNVSINIHHDEVTFAENHDNKILIRSEKGNEIITDKLIILTGHTGNKNENILQKINVPSHTKTIVINDFYGEDVGDVSYEQKNIFILGTGLTCIDIVLNIFEKDRKSFSSDHTYIPNNKEPNIVYCVSRSGIPISSRTNDFDVLSKYKFTYFLSKNIQRLRDRLKQVSTTKMNRYKQPQLDFEEHIFPLMIMEKILIYYTTLCGEEYFTERMKYIIDDCYEQFIKDLKLDIDSLINKINAVFKYDFEQLQSSQKIQDSFSLHIARVLFSCKNNPFYHNSINFMDLKDSENFWGHKFSADYLSFNYDRMINPLNYYSIEDYLQHDIYNARQGMSYNPWKACQEIVWRSGRKILKEACSFSSLSPASHAVFVKKYKTFFNKFANGASPHTNQKILSLIKGGYLRYKKLEELDVKKNSRGYVQVDNHPIDYLFKGYISEFDITTSKNSFFLSLKKSKLIKTIKDEIHPDLPENILVDKSYSPINDANRVDDRMFIFGCPVDNYSFFDTSLIRPKSVEYIITQFDLVVKRILGELHS